ncbi:glycosyltransferase family 4 protein [Acidipila sp. EB88]|nr:glycosyltransferase family 4 protein [Acidipila sp. EB88]
MPVPFELPEIAQELPCDAPLELTALAGKRVALVHDWLTGMRGGEKVLEVLCTLLPDAPLWTLLHNRGSVCAAIETRPIHTSLLQHMPGAARRYRSYLPFFPLFAECNKAKDADVVISTSHAVAKSMVRRTRTAGGSQPLHICYIHTPMRYVWDLFDEYFGPARMGAFASRFVFAPIAAALRRYDQRTSARVDVFVANSTYVAERVRRIYGREALVLPPPVDVARYGSTVREAGDRYLVVSAMVPYKRVDHAIRACATLGRKLTIVGKGPENQRLRALAAELGADVVFAGFASDAELADYYRQARALLFPGVEDFGIVPVEAIACGCPVIALAEGGILDSMTNETAEFFHEPTVAALEQAMLAFEARALSAFHPETLRARARCFSEAAFIVRLAEIVQAAVNPPALPLEIPSGLQSRRDTTELLDPPVEAAWLR